jgi:lantibiotic modifying enzyme
MKAINTLLNKSSSLVCNSSLKCLEPLIVSTSSVFSLNIISTSNGSGIFSLRHISHHLQYAKKLEQILTDCDSNTANALSLDRSQLSQDPIPFEELLFPFIYFARTQLSLRCLSQVSLLSDLAHISLERWLLQSLSRLAAPALQLEFSLFRSQYSLLRTSPGNGQQRLLYTAFVARYHGLGLIPFLLEYSLLARFWWQIWMR